MRSKVFKMAWTFIKNNGYTLSEALKTAWANVKLVAKMQKEVVKFYFKKLDGTIREAWGTLQQSMLPPVKGTGRPTPIDLQLYYDTIKESYRCFKKHQLIKFETTI